MYYYRKFFLTTSSKVKFRRFKCVNCNFLIEVHLPILRAKLTANSALFYHCTFIRNRAKYLRKKLGMALWHNGFSHHLNIHISYGHHLVYHLLHFWSGTLLIPLGKKWHMDQMHPSVRSGWNFQHLASAILGPVLAVINRVNQQMKNQVFSVSPFLSLSLHSPVQTQLFR